MHWTRRGLRAVAASALLTAMVASSATPSFDSALQRADELRSNDPAAFGALLDQLNAEAASATEPQRQLLRYFNNYRLAYSGQFDRASADLQALFDEAIDVDLKARTGALIANSFAHTRQYGEGLRYLDRVLELLPQVKGPAFRQQALGVAAILYNQLGQYELSLEYAEQVIADGSADTYHCSMQRTRIESLLALNRLPADDSDILATIARCKARNEPLVAGFLQLDLARRRARADRPELALDGLRAALEENESTRYARLISETHSLIAELSLAAGEVETARRHAERAIEFDSGPVATLPKVMALQVLYRAAQQHGDVAAQLRWHQQYAEADKAYLNEVKAKELAYQLARLETLRKNQTIEILAKQNDVLRLQQQVAQQSARNNQLLLALLGLALASIAYWAWRTKRTQLSLRRLAENDALTSLYNRRHFTAVAEQRLAAASVAGTPICLVVFDLDHFKRINDSFGHPTGDWVLRRVADVIGGCCRGNDLLGRMGGEEFALLLIGCDQDSAMLIADHCREAIAAIDSADSGHQFKVTASFGVAVATDAGYEFRTLFSQADSALYQAKHEGRNRVCGFTSALAVTAPG